MRFLIITQKVDKNDPILGFFHRWLEEFARNFKSLIVVCLEKGEYDLPSNVKVLSLGKDEGKSKPEYLTRFYRYVWDERNNYDAVFVHMNQEYVLLAGDIWRLLGKRVYLWRNHAKGNLFTSLAVLLSNKVFYTSPNSFVARFKKAVQMPAGIDTDFFKPDHTVAREKDSILLLGRISPVKKVLEFIDWVKEKGYKATIAGPILAKDKEYGERVLKALNQKIKYIGPVNQEKARELYQTHEIYANFTPAGSFDKTVIEAKACGCKLVLKNPDFIEDFNPRDHSLNALMDKLSKIL